MSLGEVSFFIYSNAYVFQLRTKLCFKVSKQHLLSLIRYHNRLHPRLNNKKKNSDCNIDRIRVYPVYFTIGILFFIRSQLKDICITVNKKLTSPNDIFHVNTIV